MIGWVRNRWARLVPNYNLSVAVTVSHGDTTDVHCVSSGYTSTHYISVIHGGPPIIDPYSANEKLHAIVPTNTAYKILQFSRTK